MRNWLLALILLSSACGDQMREATVLALDMSQVDSTSADLSQDDMTRGACPNGNCQAPTWTQLFDSYLGDGTEGHCTQCHESAPHDFYIMLKDGLQIDGTRSHIAVNGQSVLSWFGGPMPRDQNVQDPKAVTDFTAWVAAGALEN